MRHNYTDIKLSRYLFQHGFLEKFIQIHCTYLSSFHAHQLILSQCSIPLKTFPKEYRNGKIYQMLFSYLKFPSLYLDFDLISLFIPFMTEADIIQKPGFLYDINLRHERVNLIHYYKMKIKKSLYNFLTFLQHDTSFNGNDLKLRCISTPIVQVF